MGPPLKSAVRSRAATWFPHYTCATGHFQTPAGSSQPLWIESNSSQGKEVDLPPRSQPLLEAISEARRDSVSIV